MYQTFTAALSQTAVLFILMASGFVLRKRDIVKDEFCDSLSNLLMYLLLPMMVLQVMDVPFNQDMLQGGGLMLLSGFAVIGVNGVIAHSLSRRLTKNPRTFDVYRYALTFSNFGFMGYPVVEALLGKEALFYLTMYNLPYYLLSTTLGYILLDPGRRENGGFTLKAAINPVTLSILLGVALFFIPQPLPQTMQRTINLLGNTVTPLSMILIGVILGGHSIKAMFASRRGYLITLLRLVILPLLALGAFYALGFRGVSLSIPVIITAMPVAANLPVFSRQTGGDYYSGARLVFISTAVCLLTIPVFAALTRLLG